VRQRSGDSEPPDRFAGDSQPRRELRCGQEVWRLPGAGRFGLAGRWDERRY
jgi:hypothetical protein